MNWPHFWHGIAYEWRRIYRQRLDILLFKAAKHIISIFLWLLLLPLTIVLHLAGYRRVTVFTDRIGHLAIEPDCLLKEQRLGLIPQCRWFILAPPGRVANHHLLNYWKPFIRIYENGLACYVLSSMSLFGFMRYDISRYVLAVNKAQAAYKINALWDGRPPLLSLTKEDEKWSAHALRQLGLPEGAWFVCVHVREPGFSPVDEELQSHRNASIENIMPAIQEIIARGGWVIRIGDASMTPLPPLPKIIDYAHHPMKSEQLDIILCAKAKFILGNTSGIALVGSVFGIPCAIANMIPMSDLWYGIRDISIPKLLWSEHLNRYLRFDEVISSSLAKYRYAALYRKAKIRVEENSAEDIRNLAVEMIDRLDNSFVESNADKERFNCFLSQLKENHYSFGSRARIASLFLCKHPELL